MRVSCVSVKEHVSKLWLVCSCIPGLGGVRVCTSTLQGITINFPKTRTHTDMSDRKTKKKITVLAVKPDKSMRRIGSRLQACCLFEPEEELFSDSEERYTTGSNTETRAYTHTIMKHVQTTD